MLSQGIGPGDKKRKIFRIFTLILLSIILRFLVGFAPFSGEGMPEKGGDFEAQRHWMEITVNLPIQEWYKETPRNDLSWWGLDYPPLSAYWALLTGIIAKAIQPSWVELFKSRRNESPELKLFMRLSVIVADFLVLFPAFLLFGRNRGYSWTKSFWMLSCPSLLLIDHGHFQYNTVVLGLCILAVVLLLDYRRPLVATSLVTAGIWFKQMGIYYVPAFAFFLLRHCIRLRLKAGLKLLFGLALTGIFVTLVIFAPFLRLFPILLHPVITRIFPFHRGLFEDKVANFWCALAILTKFHVGLSQDQLVKLCAAVLLLALSPSLLNLLTAKPSGNRFIYALSYCSLAFFMFSYHVHEKNILIPQAPILLLTHLSPIFVFWFSNVALLSLFQLVEKDRMEIPFLLVTIFWLFLSRKALREARFTTMWKLLTVPSVLGLFAVPALQAFVQNPERYPHLFHVLNTLACAGAFFISLLYLLYQQFTCDRQYYTAIPPIKSPKPHLQ